MSIIRIMSATAAAWGISFALAYVAHIEPPRSLLEFLAGAMSLVTFVGSLVGFFGLAAEGGRK
jgi:hypothetical protein